MGNMRMSVIQTRITFPVIVLMAWLPDLVHITRQKEKKIGNLCWFMRFSHGVTRHRCSLIIFNNIFCQRAWISGGQQQRQQWSCILCVGNLIRCFPVNFVIIQDTADLASS